MPFSLSSFTTRLCKSTPGPICKACVLTHHRFYRRGELARRLAIFYAAQSIASAFSGLLSFGVFQIEGGALTNWRYLFVIEGSATIIVSFFAFWYLPLSAADAHFLTPEEREIAVHRIQTDSSAVVNEEFKLGRAMKIFKHPTTWMFLAIEICLGVPLQSVSLFLPQIVKRLGYGTIKTNLYTVAPNITGAVMLLVLGFSSDLTRWRFPFVALGFFFTFCGFVIYSAIDVTSSITVAYFATFMMTWGTSAPSVLLGKSTSFYDITKTNTNYETRCMVLQQHRRREQESRLDLHRRSHG